MALSDSSVDTAVARRLEKAFAPARRAEYAAAAQVFTEAGFRPTPRAMDRTLRRGKSFLVLVADGADGAEMARALVALEKRTAETRRRLESALRHALPVRETWKTLELPVLSEPLPPELEATVATLAEDDEAESAEHGSAED